MERRRWATPQQAADYLGVSKTTLRSLVDRGVVPAPVHLGPRMPRWDLEAIDAKLTGRPRDASEEIDRVLDAAFAGGKLQRRRPPRKGS